MSAGLPPQSITSRIELTDDSGDDILVRYRSSCLDDGEPEPRSSCTGIKTGDNVTFHVQLEAAGCPQQKVRDFSYHCVHFELNTGGSDNG